MTKLPKEKRRTHLLATKVNDEQASMIKSKAAQCGLSVSDYLLMTGCGCSPKSRLTPEEESALMQLRIHRNDLVRFFSMYNTLSAAERQGILRSSPHVRQWLSLLVAQANDVTRFLERVGAASRLPRGQGSECETKQKGICR